MIAIKQLDKTEMAMAGDDTGVKAEINGLFPEVIVDMAIAVELVQRLYPCTIEDIYKLIEHSRKSIVNKLPADLAH